MDEKKSEAYRKASEELGRITKKGLPDQPTEPVIQGAQTTQSPEFVNISDSINYSNGELSGAELKRINRTEGIEKILGYRDKIYSIDPNEVIKDKEKLKYWTGALFGLLEELKSQESEHFQTLFDEVESEILQKRRKPKSGDDDFDLLLRDNSDARQDLIHFYDKFFGNERAVEIGEELLIQYPEDALVQADLGIRYSKSKSENRKKVAQRLLEEAVKGNPVGTTGAASRLAKLYLKDGRIEDAIKVTEGTVAIRPEIGIQQQLIKLYQAAGRFKDAIALQQRIITEHPGNVAVTSSAEAVKWKYKRLERRMAKADVIKSEEEIATLKKESIHSSERTGMEDAPESEAFEDRLMTLEQVLQGPSHGDEKKLRRWVDSIFYYYNELSEDDPNRLLVTQILSNVNIAIRARAGQSVAEVYKPLKNNVHARIKLAFDYSISGYNKEAIEISEETVALAPEDIGANVQLARSCYHAGDRKNHQRAIEILENLIGTSEEENFQAGSSLMNFYWQLGHKQQAIELGQEIVSTNPENKFASAQLAKYYWETDRPLAIKLAQQNNEINPEDAPVAMQLARFYLESRRSEEAIQTLQKCLEVKPNNLHLQSRLARIYWDMGRKAEAMESAKRMLNTDHTAIRIIQVTRLFWDAGKKDEAVRSLEEAVADKSGTKELDDHGRRMLLNQLIAFKWYSGQKPEAMALAKQNYEQYKDQVEAHVQLANLYIKGFEFDEAKKIIESMNLPGEGSTKEYLWIKYYYSQVGQSQEVINRCVGYIQGQASDLGDYRYRRYLPIVMSYFYKTQPDHAIWDILEDHHQDPWLKQALGLRPGETIKQHFAVLSSRGGLDSYADKAELGERFADANRVYKGPYLIPVNRAAKEGVADFGFGYREQGTRIAPEKQKHGKVSKRDPKTWNKLP